VLVLVLDPALIIHSRLKRPENEDEDEFPHLLSAAAYTPQVL
jgi:hypothetical protein